MLENIKTLVREQRLCVLATASENRPYCSLMLYAADDECKEIYMASQKDTRKYQNLAGNPHVSLMIDTRKTEPGADTSVTHALTVTGFFREIKDAVGKDAAQDRLLKRHPSNKTFFQDPNIQIFSVRVERFLLLEGLTKAYVEKPG